MGEGSSEVTNYFTTISNIVSEVKFDNFVSSDFSSEIKMQCFRQSFAKEIFQNR